MGSRFEIASDSNGETVFSILREARVPSLTDAKRHLPLNLDYELRRMYPVLDQLPCLVDTRNWEWKPFKTGSGTNSGFFEGVDESGARWLTKMRGSFLGYREIVFERLVQRAGWLCQSSAFAILGDSSLPRFKHSRSEAIQLVTRILPEHGPDDCGPACPIAPLRGDLDQFNNPLKKFGDSSLKDALNIARADILAPLLGGNEPAGFLTTTDHQVFLIDGELMFSTCPSDVGVTDWWSMPTGPQFTRDVCAAIGSFSNEELEVMLKLPQGLQITCNWDLRDLLYQARDYGKQVARIIL